MAQVPGVFAIYINGAFLGEIVILVPCRSAQCDCVFGQGRHPVVPDAVAAAVASVQIAAVLVSANARGSAWVRQQRVTGDGLPFERDRLVQLTEDCKLVR